MNAVAQGKESLWGLNMPKTIALDQKRRKLVVKAPGEDGSPYWNFILELEGEGPVTIHRAFSYRDLVAVVSGVEYPLYNQVSSSWLGENWPSLRESIIKAMQELVREVSSEK